MVEEALAWPEGRPSMSISESESEVLFAVDVGAAWACGRMEIGMTVVIN